MTDPARPPARRTAAAGPSRQPRTNGPDTARAVSEALEEIQQRPDRDPETGKFLKGNTAAGNTLARSEVFWSAVAEAKRELLERLRSDLAVDGQAAATLEGLIDGYSEARLLRHAMFTRMVEMGGPITTKGKTRALFTSYLSALDRETRLALALGLERRAKPTSLAEYMRHRQTAEDGDR